MREALAIGQIVLVMLLWAACFPLIVLGEPYAPHLTFGALRATLAGGALLVLALVLRRPMPRRIGEWGLLALVGLGATTLGFLGMFHAADLIAPGIATVIANTQPLLATVLGLAVLRERPGYWTGVGLVAGFAGVVVLAAPGLGGAGEQTYGRGVAYIMVAVLGISVSNVLIKHVAGRADSLVAMALQLLIGALPLWLLALAAERPAGVSWSPVFVVVLVALSVPGTALAYWLWCTVLQRVPLLHANAYSFLVPVFGLSAGVLWFGERLGPVEIAGIALICVSLGLVGGGRVEVRR